VDESVCYVQDNSFQVALNREGAVPMWVGMGQLAPRPPNCQCALTKVCRAEQWMLSVAQMFRLIPYHHQNKRGRVAHHILAFSVLL
jgi:hypothetical protein